MLDRAAAPTRPAGPAAPPQFGAPLDPGFGTAGVVRKPAASLRFGPIVTTQPDGRVLFAGFAQAAAGQRLRLGAVRLHPDGRLDSGFGVGGTASIDAGPNPLNPTGVKVALDAQGRILIAGAFRRPGRQFEEWVLARLLPDGAPDTSFSGDGRIRISFADAKFYMPLTAILVRTDGRILVIGSADSTLFAAQYHPDGSVDRGFGIEGKLRATLFSGTSVYIHGAAFDAAGNLVLSGNASQPDTGADLFVTRYRPDGALDAGFGFQGTVLVDFGTGHEGTGFLAVQPDGRIVVAGRAQLAGDVYEPAVIRLLPDGGLDPDFGTGGRARFGVGRTPDNTWLNGLALLADGRVAVVGQYSNDSTGDPTQPNFRRIEHFVAVLTGAGSPNQGFDGADGVAYLPNEYVVSHNQVAVQPGDGILVFVQGDLLRLRPTSDFAALRLTLGASSFHAGPGPLTLTATVHNDDTDSAGGFLTLRASKAVGVVSSTHGTATVAPNRIDATAKLRQIPPGGAAVVTLRTTVTGFEGAIELEGSVNSGSPELNVANNTARITVLTDRNATE